jgi:hypothetical protein
VILVIFRGSGMKEVRILESMKIFV